MKEITGGNKIACRGVFDVRWHIKISVMYGMNGSDGKAIICGKTKMQQRRPIQHLLLTESIYQLLSRTQHQTELERNMCKVEDQQQDHAESRVPQLQCRHLLLCCWRTEATVNGFCRVRTG